MRHVLQQGGIAVTTADPDGKALLRTVVQLDGDTVQLVHPDLLAAAPAIRDAHAARHASAVRAQVAQPLTRVVACIRRARAGLTTLAAAAPPAAISWHAAAPLWHGAGLAAAFRACAPHAPWLLAWLLVPLMRSASRALIGRFAKPL